MKTWINGRLRSSLDSRDRGLQYGDGLFETMRVRRRQIRLLQYHLERLYHGCKQLHISAPAKHLLGAELQRIASSRCEGVLKLILTRGSGPKSARPGYRPTGIERCTRIETLHALSPLMSSADPDAPVRVRLCKTVLGISPALAGLKSLNRLESVLARSEWSDTRIWEGLMANPEGHWVCGTMTNLFLRRGSMLITPAVDRGGVAGVMRRWVLQSAAKAKLRVGQRQVRWHDLQGADEVFMTNAVVGIKSVRRIDGGRQALHFDRFDASRHLRTLLDAQ